MSDRTNESRADDTNAKYIAFSSESDPQEKELTVYYCDEQRFTNPWCMNRFTDQGTLGWASFGKAEFLGNKLDLKDLDAQSVRLVRPSFAVLPFLISVSAVGGYFGLFVLPSGDELRIWVIACVACILGLLMLRYFTVPRLEITEQQGDRKRKHYFFSASKRGWSGVFGGNARMLRYFQQSAVGPADQ